MQLGHIPLALSIATYDWSPRTAIFCLAMHFIPNADSLVERAGWADRGFHCSVTHTVWFAVVMSALVAIVSPHYAVFAFVAIMAWMRVFGILAWVLVAAYLGAFVAVFALLQQWISAGRGPAVGVTRLPSSRHAPGTPPGT